MPGSSNHPFSVRDVDFELDASVPRAWHGDRAAVSVFFNNLSILFPEGERFFIRSVVRHRGALRDAALLEEVRAFSRQEGVHTREHEVYNAMLRAQGYPVAALEAQVRRLLALPRFAGRHRDRLGLAITVALEHWTAMFAHFVLEDDSIMAGAHPTMAALWRWHAAEECEHKAVAHDVYVAAGGGYALRVAVMLVVTAVFWGQVLRQQWWMMRADAIHLRPRAWLDLGRFLLVEQRALGRLLPLWLRYFTPGFHPWQHDDSALLERWRHVYAPTLHYRRRAVTGA